MGAHCLCIPFFRFATFAVGCDFCSPSLFLGLTSQVAPLACDGLPVGASLFVRGRSSYLVGLFGPAPVLVSLGAHGNYSAGL